MFSGSAMLFVWGGIFFIMAIVVFVYACRFLMAAKQSKKDTEKMVKLAEVRLQKQYNRIATMPYEEFQQYMINSFAKSLEIVSYREISKADPDGSVSLYTLATAEMIAYIGEETIAAIDYYYGPKYIHRWTLLSYELLEKRGVISSIIEQKNVKAESVAKSMS